MSYVKFEKKVVYQKTSPPPGVDWGSVSEEMAEAAWQVWGRLAEEAFSGKVVFGVDLASATEEDKTVWWTPTATTPPKDTPASELVIDGDWWKRRSP